MNIICYLSNGYPTSEATLEKAETYIKGGCDIIEIDLPTNNPFLDNEKIQHRMKTSYSEDSSLESQVDTILSIRKNFPNQKVLILCYEHTIKQYGVQKFIDLFLEVDAESVILIAPENDTISKRLVTEGVKIASYIPFDLPEKEIVAAKSANGFIYLQAKPAGKVREGCETLDKAIKYLREERGFDQPIYCGMGVSTQEDIKNLKAAGADGAFIGSSLFNLEETPEKMAEYIKELKEASI
ncbi:MAG: tryptophan synthase subunit alpha [Vagococcus sp.]